MMNKPEGRTLTLMLVNFVVLVVLLRSGATGIAQKRNAPAHELSEHMQSLVDEGHIAGGTCPVEVVVRHPVINP
jgi:hypothetical protein